jgi:hypothetical protein
MTDQIGRNADAQRERDRAEIAWLIDEVLHELARAKGQFWDISEADERVMADTIIAWCMDRYE